GVTALLHEEVVQSPVVQAPVVEHHHQPARRRMAHQGRPLHARELPLSFGLPLGFRQAALGVEKSLVVGGGITVRRGSGAELVPVVRRERPFRRAREHLADGFAGLLAGKLRAEEILLPLWRGPLIHALTPFKKQVRESLSKNKLPRGGEKGTKNRIRVLIAL